MVTYPLSIIIIIIVLILRNL